MRFITIWRRYRKGVIGNAGLAVAVLTLLYGDQFTHEQYADAVAIGVALLTGLGIVKAPNDP